MTKAKSALILGGQMGQIPPELAEEVLVLCGRCCCLCHRYLPTYLQVHHIVLASEGGSDDLDNLISVCVTCHIDVHTKAPFTRRFSHGELKRRRDHAYALVAEGKLPAGEPDPRWIAEVSSSVVALFQQQRPDDLTAAAVEILLAATESSRGILLLKCMGSTVVQAGLRRFAEGSDPRQEAEYLHGLEQLELRELVQEVAPDEYAVTHDGYRYADLLLTSASDAPSE